MKGLASRAGLSGVLDCNLSCNYLRRDVPALAGLPPVELGVRHGNATSTISGLIGPDLRSLKEVTGYGDVHESRSSLICSWAIRSRLKRTLALRASSTFVFESCLDLVIKGSIGVLSSAFCRSQNLANFSAITQVLALVDHSSMYSLATFVFDPAQLSIIPIKISLVPFPVGLLQFSL